MHVLDCSGKEKNTNKDSHIVSKDEKGEGNGRSTKEEQTSVMLFRAPNSDKKIRSHPEPLRTTDKYMLHNS